jgi:hypothetical protein
MGYLKKLGQMQLFYFKSKIYLLKSKKVFHKLFDFNQNDFENQNI